MPGMHLSASKAVCLSQPTAGAPEDMVIDPIAVYSWFHQFKRHLPTAQNADKSRCEGTR
jgi:hypothetical protein